MKRIWLPILMAIFLAIIPAAASAQAFRSVPGEVCVGVPWGEAATVATPDRGCVYKGEPRVGQVPGGYYANVEGRDALEFEEFVTTEITLRRLDNATPLTVRGPIPVAPPAPKFIVPLIRSEGMRCAIVFGTFETFLTADNGCKFRSPDGQPKLGGIPAGFYADTIWGPVGPGEVFETAEVTLRTLDDSEVPLALVPISTFAGNRVFVKPPPPASAVAQAQAAQPSPATPACPAFPPNIDAAANLIGITNGNKTDIKVLDPAAGKIEYHGPAQGIGVPFCFRADTSTGSHLRNPNGTFSDVTWWFVGAGPHLALGPAPQPAAQTTVATATVISCPNSGDDVARAFGVSENQISSVGQFFAKFSREPGGRTWLYNKTESGDLRGGPTLRFTVPSNWKVDHPGGSGVGPGAQVETIVSTMRCG